MKPETDLLTAGIYHFLFSHAAEFAKNPYLLKGLGFLK